MNRYTLLLFCVLTAILQSSSLADDLDPGDDLTTTTTAQPTTWEPMIVHFSASGEHGSASLVNPPTTRPALSDDAIGEANQWLGMKPLIQPAKGGINKDVAVISAWERVVQGDKPVYIQHSSSVTEGETEEKIHAIFAQDYTLCFAADFDILMNATPAKKDQILADFFKITDIQMTVHQVSSDPKNIRAAVEDNAPKFNVYKLPFGASDEAKSWPKLAHNFIHHDGFKWRMTSDQMAGQVGVYEFRLKLTVEGKMAKNEDTKIRTIEGAIRIAVVNDKKWSVDKLSFNTFRKPGEKDLVRKGKIVGTTQVSQ